MRSDGWSDAPARLVQYRDRPEARMDRVQGGYLVRRMAAQGKAAAPLSNECNRLVITAGWGGMQILYDLMHRNRLHAPPLVPFGTAPAAPRAHGLQRLGTGAAGAVGQPWCEAGSRARHRAGAGMSYRAAP